MLTEIIASGSVGGSDLGYVHRPIHLHTGRPVVIFAHGYAAPVPAPLGIDYGQRLLTERYGIPVVATDLAGDSWGAAADSRVDAVLSFMSSRFGCDTTRVAFIAASMGNFTAYTYAIDHTAVKAVVSVLPANDLAGFYANATYTASIDTAYGGTADAGEISSHSPLARAAEISARVTAGLRAQVWYSTNDTVVTPGSAAAFTAAAGITDVRSMGAVAHLPSGMDSTVIASTIAAALT